MGNRLSLMAAIGALATGSFASQAPEPRATFRADVDLTVIEVTVRGRDGQLLTDLRSDEFHISERKARLPLEQFAVDRQPLTMAVMVQAKGDVPTHRAWAQRLVDALGENDRVVIGSYGTEVAVNPLMTSDRQVLRRILDEELWYGYWAPISAAIQRGSLALPSDAARRAVVLIGVDTLETECPRQASCVASELARDTLAARGTVPYAIVTGLESNFTTAGPVDTWKLMPGQERIGDGRLLKTVKASGAYLSTRTIDTSERPAAAAAVLEQLRVRYVLGFAPQAAGALEQIAIDVSRRGATAVVQSQRSVRRRP
jgi:hypothetical protein